VSAPGALRCAPEHTAAVHIARAMRPSTDRTPYLTSLTRARVGDRRAFMKCVAKAPKFHLSSVVLEN
jgi:hypothetical protein